MTHTRSSRMAMAPILQASAAHAVLAQPPLLSLIASFQRGVPSIAKPLLLHCIGDGLVYCTNTRVRLPGDDDNLRLPYWYKTLPLYPRIVTPLYKSVRPLSLWLDHVLPEAIAKCECTKSHRVLEAWLRTTSSASFNRNEKPGRLYRQIVHRVSEAAASFGRVDLLQWLHELQVSKSFMPAQQRRLVELAARHGHATVLRWLDTTFGRAILEGLEDSVVWEMARCGHAEAVRWLVDRGLADLSPYTLDVAINRGHAELLRYLLQLWASDGVNEPHRMLQDGKRLRLAVLRGRLRVVECLFEWKLPPVTTHTALLAIRLGFLDIAKFVLDRRDRDGPFLHGDVCQWVRRERLDILKMVASVPDCKMLGCSVLYYTHYTSASHDILRTLLTLSTADDIAKTLVWTALYNREVAEVILDEAAASLPTDGAAFARRIMDEVDAGQDHDSTTPSYYWWIMEGSMLDIEQRLWRAEVREIRAIGLYLAWQRPDGEELQALKAHDARRPPETRVFDDRHHSELCIEVSSLK